LANHVKFQISENEKSIKAWTSVRIISAAAWSAIAYIFVYVSIRLLCESGTIEVDGLGVVKWYSFIPNGWKVSTDGRGSPPVVNFELIILERTAYYFFCPLIYMEKMTLGAYYVSEVM